VTLPVPDAGPAAESGARPVLQLHVTRHCNLRCRHCYSHSGPSERETLAEAQVLRLLEDARALGYAVLNISGGEPLIDPGIFTWLEAGRALGFQIDLISNGMLITPAIAERLAASVDLMAISIDGMPATHNRMRGSRAAFAGMERGVEALQAAGVTFGLIHTATEASLAELRWLFGWAVEHGAKLLQLHPLERSGRAEGMPDARFTEGEFETRLSLLADIIGRDFEDLLVHTDAMPVALLAQACDSEVRTLANASGIPFSALVDPLVVGPDGLVTPLVYGLDPALSVGSLATAPLATLAEAYRHHGLERLLQHQRAVQHDILQTCEWPYVAWHAALAARPFGFAPALLPA